MKFLQNLPIFNKILLNFKNKNKKTEHPDNLKLKNNVMIQILYGKHAIIFKAIIPRTPAFIRHVQKSLQSIMNTNSDEKLPFYMYYYNDTPKFLQYNCLNKKYKQNINILITSISEELKIHLNPGLKEYLVKLNNELSFTDVSFDKSKGIYNLKINWLINNKINSTSYFSSSTKNKSAIFSAVCKLLALEDKLYRDKNIDLNEFNLDSSYVDLINSPKFLGHSFIEIDKEKFNCMDNETYVIKYIKEEDYK